MAVECLAESVNFEQRTRLPPLTFWSQMKLQLTSDKRNGSVRPTI